MEEFEEQAITNATCKPKIWKRYVDDTFPVLDRDHVDDFLQHLNCQQSTIRFTMETERDNTIPFLDITVTRDSDCLVTTTVYRKPTHTNQYLAYDSHHDMTTWPCQTPHNESVSYFWEKETLVICTCF